MNPAGLALTDDLIFFSRIAATARAVGLEVRQARTPPELVELAGKFNPGGVTVDLQNPGLEITVLLEQLRGVCPRMPRVVAYGSHVEAEVLRAAREAGCDRVLPRSRFVKELDQDISTWLQPPEHP